MSTTVAQVARVAAVVAMLGIAAALATPPGRLPIALRGLARLFHAKCSTDGRGVPAWKRALALVLVLSAAAVCCL